MQYSPKLKNVMEEIKAVLKKHDVGAVVVLHTPGHSEYLNRLDPSYACVIQNGDEVRVRARLNEDFKGDKRAWEKKMEDTANMLHLLSIVPGRQAMSIGELSKTVDKIIDAEHLGDGHTTHNQQNN